MRVQYLDKAVFNLDYGQLKLVFCALKERKQVIENAPHLRTALPCMTPCFDWFEAVYFWMGLKLYDLVAGSRLLHLSRYYSAQESVELFPTLARKGKDRTLKGTVVYYDGQMNDSRVNVGLACTAALAGAAVLNHAAVISFLKDEGSNRIIGAHIQDNLTGKGFDTYARVIVNAAGPFCDSVRKMADNDAKPMICPSSGVHIVLPDYYSPEGMGLIIPKTKDGLVVFMLPWLSTACRCSFCLEWYSPIGNTESISRDHVVCEDYPGFVTITGGKWTTCRSMAEDAVDTAIKSGYDPASFTVLAQQYVCMKQSYSGKVVPGVMDTATAKHLSHAYGTLAERVAGIAQNEHLGKQLAHGYPFLEAEMVYCARHEYCESVVEFIARRSQLAFLDTDAAGRALSRIIQILAAEHNWSKSRQKQKVQKATEFLKTFKSSKNAQFHDGKHNYFRLYRKGWFWKKMERRRRRGEMEIAEALWEVLTVVDGGGKGIERSEADRAFLAKENGCLEIKMKGILDELKRLKDHNNFMHDEVERLEMSLKHSKQKVLADTTQMYEKKIAELMKQLEEQQAHSESAEEQLDVMKKLLSDHQKSMQQYQKENFTYQKALTDTTQMYEKKIADLKQELDDGHARFKGVEEELNMTKMQLRDHQNSNQIQGQKVIDELRLKLQESHQLHKKTVNELDSLKAEYKVQLTDKATLKEELNAVRQSLLIEEKQRKAFETELLKSKMLVPENHDDFEQYQKENSTYQKTLSDTTQMYEKKIAGLKQELDDGHARFKGVEEELDMTKMQLRDHQNSNQIQGQKVIDELRLKLQESHQLHQKTVNELDSLKAEYKVQLTDKATLKEELNAVRQSLLIEEKQRKTFETELLKSKMLVPENHDDFENINQEKIVEEGSLDALLMLLRSSQNTTILRVAFGAIANLAMNEDHHYHQVLEEPV
ncbi:unnamed protein product [Camellia sinensis]